jgi:hypothetical protein
MQKNADLYNLTQQLQGTMYQAGQKQYLALLSDEARDNQPQRPALMTIRGGYAESIGWMMAQLLEFDPEPLTVEKFRVRAVYSAPRLSQALLELIASEKWANRIGEEYSLTNEGRAVITNLVNQRNMMFADFEPIPTDDLSQLVDLSQRIINASLDRGDEKATWCLRYSNKRKPNDSVSAISKLIHVCSDYNAFRDDAHMTAYTAQGVDGMTWEAFSFIDNGNASTANDLFDQLAYRGWTIDEWQNALNCLADKGWIEGGVSGYQSTELGKSISQIVEQKTDELFYAPWDILSDDEQVEYVRLLNTLNDTCMGLINE